VEALVRGVRRLVEGGAHRGREERLEVAAADLAVGVLARDHLALLREPELALHAARRLREDRVVAGAAATPDRAAAAVEEAKPHARLAKHGDQRRLRLVELPVGGDVAAILVAVGISEHHFLHAA
jgi:hypothetical protein